MAPALEAQSYNYQMHTFRCQVTLAGTRKHSPTPLQAAKLNSKSVAWKKSEGTLFWLGSRKEEVWGSGEDSSPTFPV